jgi:hypothetical protein
MRPLMQPNPTDLGKNRRLSSDTGLAQISGRTDDLLYFTWEVNGSATRAGGPGNFDDHLDPRHPVAVWGLCG